MATARTNGVRALRLDARDLGFLSDLPQLEFLELRSDGRANLDPVASLPNLRALLINHSALTGTISLDSHPRLEWLAIKLSGRGGRENLPGFLAGHPGIRHLRLSEVPFTALADQLAAVADLVAGQAAEGRGAVWIRGLQFDDDGSGAAALLRDAEEDLYA